MKNLFYPILMLLGLASSGVRAEKTATMSGDWCENNSAVVFTSPDGNISGGYSNGYVHIYDMNTGTSQYWGDNDNTYIAFSATNSGYIPGAVSDADVTCCRPAYLKDGVWTEVEMTYGNFGSILCSTEDGYLMGGWVQKGIAFLPVVWELGEMKMLKIPATDPLGMPSRGGIVCGISEDKSSYIGRFYSYLGDEFVAVWNNPDEECEILFLDMSYDESKRPQGLTFPQESDYITVTEAENSTLYWQQYDQWGVALNAYCAAYAKSGFMLSDYVEGHYVVASPKGDYLGASIVTGSGQKIPFIYDIKARKMTRFDTLTDGIVLSITDAGDATLGTPSFSLMRYTYLYLSENEKLVRLDSYLKNEYGLDIYNSSNGIGAFLNYNVEGSWIISGDGTTLHGYHYDADIIVYNFHIRLSESVGVESVKTNEGMVFENNTLRLARNCDMEVYSLSGSRVLSLENASGEVFFGALARGVYFVRCSSKGVSRSQKVVVR